MDVFSVARHISVSIHRSPAEVYAFAANPVNLPKWAKGLSGSIENVDGEWIADSPMGRVKVRFAPKNDLGVLDHDVVLASGETVHNPMRVVANGQGSEVIFTLFRRAGVGDEDFAADARAVQRDLEALKELLEGPSPRIR
ncbi:MAG: SRPBCC family protein [Candidatus Binatia bacterium]